jgi:hypothetical protein
VLNQSQSTRRKKYRGKQLAGNQGVYSAS